MGAVLDRGGGAGEGGRSVAGIFELPSARSVEGLCRWMHVVASTHLSRSLDFSVFL